MFKSYLNCKYTIYNEFYERKLKLKRKEVNESDKLRFAKGNQFENDYLKELEKKYSKVIDLKKDKKTPKEEIAKETIKCMKEGYEVIRGGYLIDEKWRGEFDFLEINKKNKSKQISLRKQTHIILSFFWKCRVIRFLSVMVVRKDFKPHSKSILLLFSAKNSLKSSFKFS